MGELFNQTPTKAIKGEDITIGEKYGGEIFVSEYDELFCYSGVLKIADDRSIDILNKWPINMIGKHSSDILNAKGIINFIRIVDGRIVLDDFVDAQWCSDKLFKKIKATVSYPSVESYYSVIVNNDEDEVLTRAVFGLTYSELSRLTECYAKALGVFNGYQQYPRVTRSIQSANRCDITGAWIPKNYPYITFAESDRDLSHISLWGFYRHIQLLMRNSAKSLFGQLLIKFGAEPELLEKVINIGRKVLGKTIITWDMANPE